MEYVKCNYCNNDETKLLFSKKDKFGLSDCDFKVVQCQICGLIYVNPRPSEEEIAKFYPETYSWKETLKAESKITQTKIRLGKIQADMASRFTENPINSEWFGTRYNGITISLYGYLVAKLLWLFTLKTITSATSTGRKRVSK